MLRTTILTGLATALMLGIGAGITPAQSITPVYDQDDYDRAQVDRYLDVEVWTSNSDGEYYEGDNIVIYFRSSRDAFVSIYSIDTRGRVNLLFPTFEGEDNFVNGGVTYSLPGSDADYDLEVSGPEGFENIQIVACRERFPVPNWYRGAELTVNDGEDRDSYMDWVNANYFVDYSGQRFAYDRAVVYVNEWEPDYFRPVYYPAYPSWTVYGNCYIDYPWGASVYINGIYWGCVPLYIPRIAVGWHTITVYDPYGYCWEHDFHVSHYNTVVFNHTIINTSPNVKSKYKEVYQAGYRDPVRNGYPDFAERKSAIVTSLKHSGGKTFTSGKGGGSDDIDMDGATKKFARGSTKVVKTERGYETDASTAVIPDKGTGRLGSTSRNRSGATTFESTKGKSDNSSGTSDSDRSQRRTTGGKSKSSPSSVGSSSGGQNQSSGSSGKSGSSSTIERRKTSGKTESTVIPKQTAPVKQEPAKTDSEKKETRPENSAGATKSKSSSGGSSTAPTKSSGGGSSSTQSQGGQKGTSGGGKGKK